ncbi:hypothetical protein [Streptomyces iconiensis]|uniref:Uncharacterized protein n=1 Tax=Streptomyces iconiensis TaxID=1384038 RepID=A0ABT6ZZ89_9ACTN|nr:hypothetical protein [Streptomyces iconiensis]MDJ1134378.1 hypothetical protein [Streptomyces iconiensis]
MQKTDSAPREKDIAQRPAMRETRRRSAAPGSPGVGDGPMSYGPRGSADPSDPEAHIFRGED